MKPKTLSQLTSKELCARAATFSRLARYSPEIDAVNTDAWIEARKLLLASARKYIEAAKSRHGG